MSELLCNSVDLYCVPIIDVSFDVISLHSPAAEKTSIVIQFITYSVVTLCVRWNQGWIPLLESPITAAALSKSMTVCMDLTVFGSARKDEQVKLRRKKNATHFGDWQMRVERAITESVTTFQMFFLKFIRTGLCTQRKCWIIVHCSYSATENI